MQGIGSPEAEIVNKNKEKKIQKVRTMLEQNKKMDESQ